MTKDSKAPLSVDELESEIGDEPVTYTSNGAKGKLAFSLTASDTQSNAITYIQRDVFDKALKLFKTTSNPIMAIGPTGSGKTRMWAEVAKTMKMGFSRYCVDDTVSLRELLGEFILVRDGDATTTKLNLGQMAQDLKKPMMVCIDELNRMSENKISPLNQITDSRRIYIKSYGTIELHPECRIVGTMNPYSGIYGGTHKTDASLINRFLCMEVPQFNKEELERILPKTDKDFIAKLISFYLKTQEAILKQELDFEFSIRNLAYICEAMDAGLSLNEAVDVGVIQAVKLTSDKDQADLVLNMAVGVFGTQLIKR